MPAAALSQVQQRAGQPPNSTITGNTAGVDAGGIYTCVAGYPPYGCTGAGSLDLTNSVVTGNTPNDIVP